MTRGLLLTTSERAKLIGVLSLLAAHGLTWDAVITVSLPASGKLNDLDLCAAHLGQLTNWERQFVASMQAWSGRFTERQNEVLARIAAKIRAMAAAGEP